eukprot:gb/GFBE01081513.1/.p1 GENE.gb/GFBE01081513.1/~~gb/GFBE01081513.1/.p1  ORF type:complete len:521 (+),score=110.75 gb/GFBE01081513.1/:1-1563(+)
MSASAATSELLKSLAHGNSCPAFGNLTRLADTENLDSGSEAGTSLEHTPPTAIAGGCGGWFEEHVAAVGAPRPARPQHARTPETEGRRKAALEKVQHMAERYRAKLEQRPLGLPRVARSSPDLQTEQDTRAKSNEDELHRSSSSSLPLKPSQGFSRPTRCYEGLACSQLFAMMPKWAQTFGTALLGLDQGLADPGFGSRENAVIIFDWDDTLLPTTYILGTVLPSLPEEERHGELPDSSPHAAPLAAHAHLVGFLLRAARRSARVAIVSNSLSPWVEASGARYLPGLDLEALLQELEVPVYYARRHVPNIPVNYKVQRWKVFIDRSSGGRIGVDIVPESDGTLTVARIEEGGLMDAWNQAHPSEEVLPGDHFGEVNGLKTNLAMECRKPQKLHISMFRAVPDRDPYVEAKRIDMATCLDKFYGRGHSGWKQNVLSIGDATTEQQAIKEVLQNRPLKPCWKQESPKPFCKTVNLIDRPSLEQLSNELRILLVWLSRMVEYDKDFDLWMDGLDDLEAKLFKA